MKYISILSSLLFLTLVNGQVYTTYHWHLQQPIYWPAGSAAGLSYQKAWESMTNGGAHPQDNLEQIFGWDDRVAAYQYRIRDAIATISQPNGGAQISYSGCLVENVNSLADHYSLGYSPGWESTFQQARSWSTTNGFPRLDVVIFPYHHVLGPLVDENALRKEIRIYKQLYPQIWGNGMSVGYFPAELSFSERMIKVLVEEGIDWVFVANNHLSRSCPNFPLVLGNGGEMCDPPNPADQLNPPQTNWFSKTIDRGCTPTNAYPFAYQPHIAQYIEPESGEVYSIIVVPVAQAMSWEDGYQQYGMEDIDQIADAGDNNHPMLIVLAHDGDNAYGGGYSYYMENVQNFCNQAEMQGYHPTVVQQFLYEHPVDPGDVVHVEDGSWVNADGDFGSPDFINWNWPLYDSSGNFDIESGWAVDARNWAVITAAQNRVETAEQMAGGVDISGIQNPDIYSAGNAELAWHYFLPSLTSGYMYYGSAMDMEVKPTVACNRATEYADQIIGGGSADLTPPSIWALQQFPHNPGGIGFGSLWGYQQVQHGRDFRIWTFAYDVSGISNVTLYYRQDNDGMNPLSSHQNEMYSGGNEVGDWVGLDMQQRDFPAGNVFNDPDIDFFIMPDYIADQYTVHITEPGIVDEGGVLIDYYVEAVDSAGNVKRTPIYHTFVGTGEGSSSGASVSWQPENPAAGETVDIFYDLTLGTLPSNTDPVYIHIGHSQWQDIIQPDPVMNYVEGSGLWAYDYAIPSTATQVDFVFNNGQGTWDNNQGQDWHIPVSGGNPGNPFIMDGNVDEGAALIAEFNNRHIYAVFHDTQLYVAAESGTGTGSDEFIFVSDGSSGMAPAPWAKSGQVAQWSCFLANEESNGWCGWFDLNGNGQLACGSYLEGVFSLQDEFQTIPGSVFISAAQYQSANGGSLTGQVPASVDGDINIQISEFVEFPLTAVLPGDLNDDQLVDVLDVVILVEAILGGSQPENADLNQDQIIDILDIVIMVEIILGDG